MQIESQAPCPRCFAEVEFAKNIVPRLWQARLCLKCKAAIGEWAFSTNGVVGKMFCPKMIQSMCKELAGRIIQWASFSDELVVVPVLDAAFMFAADLLRAMRVERANQTAVVYFVRARSYEGTVRGKLKLSGFDELPGGTNRRYLIVDTVYDSGETYDSVYWKIREKSAETDFHVKGAVLLKKVRDNRRPQVEEPNFVGMNIPDLFVYGYGMDWNEGGRGRPDVVAVKGK